MAFIAGAWRPGTGVYGIGVGASHSTQAAPVPPPAGVVIAPVQAGGAGGAPIGTPWPRPPVDPPPLPPLPGASMVSAAPTQPARQHTAVPASTLQYAMIAMAGAVRAASIPPFEWLGDRFARLLRLYGMPKDFWELWAELWSLIWQAVLFQLDYLPGIGEGKRTWKEVEDYRENWARRFADLLQRLLDDAFKLTIDQIMGTEDADAKFSEASLERFKKKRDAYNEPLVRNTLWEIFFVFGQHVVVNDINAPENLDTTLDVLGRLKSCDILMSEALETLGTEVLWWGNVASTPEPYRSHFKHALSDAKKAENK